MNGFRSTLIEKPELNDLNNWPMHVDTATMSSKNRAKFIRNVEIIKYFQQGVSVKKTAMTHNVSPSMVYYLLNRALGTYDGEPPALYKGLIPNLIQHEKQRQSPMPTLADGRGSVFAFKALLKKYPDIEVELQAKIKASYRGTATSENLTPNILHKTFLSLLIQFGVPKDHYPYTTQSLAYQSVRRYFHDYLSELRCPESRPWRESISKRSDMAFEEIQIDEQHFDCETAIEFEIFGRRTLVRVKRFWIVMATDCSTGCILAFHFSINLRCSQWDIMNVLKQIHYPKPKLTIQTPSLSYPEGPNLNDLKAWLPRVQIGVISLDNDMAHFGNNCIQYAHDQQACLHYGHPENPNAREQIERLFLMINTVTHRHRSTTGSHSHDPIKESKRLKKKPPKVNVQTLLEMMSIQIAEYNQKPQARLGGICPVEKLKELIQHQYYCMRPPQAPQSQLVKDPKLRKLHFSKTKKQHPWVNFYGVRYTVMDWSKSVNTTTTVSIEFDPQDIRKIKAYLPNGDFIAELIVPRMWRRYAHGIVTRKRIIKTTKNLLFASGDAFTEYFTILQKNFHKPSVQLEMVRLGFENSQSRELVLDMVKTDDLSEVGFSSNSYEQSANYISSQIRMPWEQVKIS
ncbi:hypothetical protein [Kangiella koreensis]|uniref:Integrase catalytic domain-containing protein n=1 Tax=Kangiella koreensis (strain DSM 16069 / JCM 12317 / KCTC 12182 / SW-125) TaxID=523791 RepID=C7RBN3_KANKD|nr:hypothetical protein [Kangiella koreensis]ACV26675.1 hypothetical protein Kkor_1256 [Kangiella koreensis DSM 16069]